VSVATSVPLSEYLNTSYRPDCDYLEGELLERNVGEAEHSRLQTKIAAWLFTREKKLGITVYTEQRVQVKARRFRVPDITVMAGEGPATGIIRTPPFLCIEILSPEDRLTQMRERVGDYLELGVRFVWVIDPRTRLATIYTTDSVREVKDGVLSTENPEIRVDLNELG